MLKDLDIDLTKSETRTLLGFIALYSILIIVILSISSFVYFNSQKDLMLQKKRQVLQEYANDFMFRLKDLHVNFDKYQFYPRDEKFNSAIFDSDKTLIFSTLNSQNIEFDEVAYTSNNQIHFINQPESYYLGAKYIVIEIPDDGIWKSAVLKEIGIYSFFMFIFMVIVGYFMSKLFIKPMKDSLHLLDRFIKDTTHELNTPISAIMQNIEMIDKDNLDDKTIKKINRIEIGAKTISNIYEDLTFLTLKNKLISQNENLNLTHIISQRAEYFKSLANSKKLSIDLDLQEEVYLKCDNKKISKLIDNLLSNAIKYNKVNGSIKISLKSNYFEVIDTGIGISKENQENLFKRYTRFNTSAGGFGIGLNIVSLIAKEYNLKIDVSSELNKGTRFKVSW